VNLVKYLRDYLLGIDAKPKYVLPTRNPEAVSGHIVRWWLERWASERVERPGVLARIAAHSLVHPIRHGARVLVHRKRSRGSHDFVSMNEFRAAVHQPTRPWATNIS
jgi:hypothetical protein